MEIRKTLTANDVGLTGTHQAGMHVPKTDPELMRFFPILNHRRLNPRVDLALYVPALEERFTAHFIYYNNKHLTGGTRDEYRLTGMTAVFRALNAQPEDLLVLSEGTSGEIVVRLDQHISHAATGNSAPLKIKGWIVTRRDVQE